ncbi:MAG: hypothetical protein JXR37_07710 [Kiritimatiellae bacterium]|nr:hypothetical protein [Kiritimatiellia bacterium]
MKRLLAILKGAGGDSRAGSAVTGAFLLMSIVSALALSLLSYTLATGHVPFQPAPKEEAGAEQPAAAPTATIRPQKADLVEQLRQELESTKNEYQRKLTAIEAAKSKIADEQAILLDLRQRLETLQTQIEANVQEMSDSERKNLRRLAEVYGRMEPDNVAQILRKDDKVRAAKILYLMGERQAAGVLDAVVATGDDADKKLAVEWGNIIRKMRSETDRRTTP